MTVDLVVRNCVLATSTSVLGAGIACDGGVIVQIAKDSFLPKAERTFDARGNLVLPGVIDAHVHMRAPGKTSYKEDWVTGTTAAAFGGVTTIFDMPTNSDKSWEVTNVNVLNNKMEAAKRDSIIDFGLYGLISPGNVAQITPLGKAGAIGFKMFLAPSASESEILSDSEIIEAFVATSATGLRTEVHAENASLLKANELRIKNRGRKDILAHLEIRDNLSEAEAVARIARFAGATNAKVQIAHLSAKESVDIVADAKTSGFCVSAEVTPHHLLLDASDYARVGSAIKVNPPIRQEADNIRLWQGLQNGTIDCVVSDHAPHAPEEKFNGDLWSTVSGFSGVEIAVPLMLTQVNAERISIHRYVQVSSENPARLFGIFPKKGAIAVGSDCDLTIVDLKKEGIIKSENLHSKSKVTPFDGSMVKGLPVATVVRGNIVMQYGELCERQKGNLVTPSGRTG